jgi:thiol-disulfide isomerase/thioredoxin
MKRISIPILLAICLFTSCTSKNNEIVISGTIIGDMPENIRHTVPINGVSMWGFNDTIFPDANGHFTITTQCDNPAIIRFFARGLDHYLIVEPGQDYKVIIDRTNQDFTVNDNNSKAQALLASFPNQSHPQLDELWHLGDSSVSVIRNTILERQNNEINQINQLYNDKQITTDVRDLLIQTRTLYNACVMSCAASYKYTMPLLQEETETGDEQVLALWNESNQALSPGDRYFFSSPLAYEFLYFSVMCQVYSKLGFQKYKDVGMEHRTKGLRNTLNLKFADDYLDPKTLEFYKASYLFINAFQEKYEKELISLIEQYQQDYPNSPFSHYITPFHDKIAGFHAVTQQDFAPAMNIIDNYSAVSSYDELISRFKGQKVYIDVWATWCSPCKSEFKHSAALKDYLSAQGITMLYISTDRDAEDEQWKKMIKYYNLQGYHVRANDPLTAELYRMLAIEGIPHYAIADENGKILIPHAHRPSALAQLQEQIAGL